MPCNPGTLSDQPSSAIRDPSGEKNRIPGEVERVTGQREDPLVRTVRIDDPGRNPPVRRRGRDHDVGSVRRPARAAGHAKRCDAPRSELSEMEAAPVRDAAVGLAEPVGAECGPPREEQAIVTTATAVARWA